MMPVEMEETLRFLAEYGLIVLTVVLFLDQLAVPVPPEPFLLGAGALAAEHRLDPLLAGVLALAAAQAGNAIWYVLGRLKGTRILRFLCSLSLEPDSCVRRMEDSFTKHGTKSLLIAKFIPGLNTVSPAMAGIVRVKAVPFFAFNAAGTIFWIGTWGVLGYLFHRQLERVVSVASSFGTWSLTGMIGAVVLYGGAKYLQRRRVLEALRAERISVDELKRMLDAREPVIVLDARHALALDAEPYLIPGAIRIAPDEIEARHREIPRDRPVVVYCT
jgi:membrane protein DedA with SNARE-associated domain